MVVLVELEIHRYTGNTKIWRFGRFGIFFFIFLGAFKIPGNFGDCRTKFYRTVVLNFMWGTIKFRIIFQYAVRCTYVSFCGGKKRLFWSHSIYGDYERLQLCYIQPSEYENILQSGNKKSSSWTIWSRVVHYWQCVSR